MKRAVYRFRDFRIGPDHEQDAEPWTFAMQCVDCHSSSVAGEQVEDAQDWAKRHLRANPEHRKYREHVTRPYRAEPGMWR